MPVTINGTSGITGNTGTLISATTIGVGGATPSASGAGITFPATQSASTNANTLDDYEEGTFSITATGDSGGIVGTWTPITCTYIRIGRTVTVHLPMGGSNFGFNSLTGFYRWTGLPFSTAGVGDGSGVFSTGSISSAVVFTMYLTGVDIWFYAPNNTNATNGGAATITYVVG
jgi:hypothetical protein